jgi:hypothetical protein
MPVKSVPAPHLGPNRTVKFGRKVSDPNSKKLHFHAYAGKLAPPPPSVDYSAKAPNSIQDIFKNDTLGCCVIADNCHGLGIVTGNASKEFVTPDSAVIKEYSAIGGYVPGDESTDNGCDPEVALNYYTTTGYADGSKLVAWMAVDATNETLVKQAVNELLNAAIAVNLPDAWTNPMPSGNGFVWDVAGPPDPEQGHEVCIYGYNAQGVLIDSWGLKGTVTWAALAKYAVSAAQGALYTRLFADIVGTSGTSPGGLPLTQIETDFNAMGGNIPVVTPPAPPAPPVPPVNPPTPSTWPPAPAGWVVVGVNGTQITIDPADSIINAPGYRLNGSSSSGASSMPINWAAILALLPQLMPVIQAIIQAVTTPSGVKGRLGATGPATYNATPANVDNGLDNNAFLVNLLAQVIGGGLPATDPVVVALQKDITANMEALAASVVAFQAASTEPGVADFISYSGDGTNYEVDSAATPPVLVKSSAIPAASIPYVVPPTTS